MYGLILRTMIITACLVVWSQAGHARPARHFKTLKGHKNFVMQIAVASKARVVATVSQDGTARLWKLPGGQKLVQIKGDDDESFNAIAIDPDARHVAISVASTVRVYAIKKRKAKKLFDLEGHKQEINALAFDKAGTTLASCGDGVRLWSIAGKEITKIVADKKVTDVRFSPASGEIVAVQPDGIYFYGRSSFSQTRKIALKGALRVAFDAEGKQLAAVGSGTMTVISAAGKKLWSKDKLAAETYAAFAGKLVLSAFRGDKLVAHDTRTGALKWFAKGREGISVFAVKGKIIVSGGGEGRVWLWKI